MNKNVIKTNMIHSDFNQFKVIWKFEEKFPNNQISHHFIKVSHCVSKLFIDF